MARLPYPARCLGAALFLALALPACEHDTTCTAEVTEGAGTFKGSAVGVRPDADLKREALHVACGKMCASRDPNKTEGCVSRCSVDAEAGKIGLHNTCVKEGSR
jgi:hypothetical protein